MNKPRTKKVLVRSTGGGSDISYFPKKTESTLIRQLLQELPDLGLLCLQKHQKGRFYEVKGFKQDYWIDTSSEKIPILQP